MKSLNYSSGFIRNQVEVEFSKICNNELEKFNELCLICDDINVFLDSFNNGDRSLEHYIKLINTRICQHMVSATILIGKGFVIDGINLVRSSFEDQWLIQNMYFKEGYFNEWLEGQGVRPWRLRQLKEIEDIKEENEIIYKALCNISHCSVTSIEHMTSIDGGMDTIINDFRLVLISFYSYLVQMIEGFEDYYKASEYIDKINNKLLSLNIIME